MAAPSLAFIVAQPQPLNRFPAWPHRIDEFPADDIFGQLGGYAPREEPGELPLPADPQRSEVR